MNDLNYDDYLAAKTAKHFNPQVEFGDWVNDNEDRLLDRFLEYYDGIIEIPMVKNWSPAIIKLWDDFLEKQWENYKEVYYD